MADKLKEIPAKILEWWNKFTTRQKSIIIGAAAVVIFAFAIIMYVMSKPQYVRLITCETTSQASEIIDTLDSAGIAHKESNDGLKIDVESSQQSAANLALGSAGYVPDALDLNDYLGGSMSTTATDKERLYNSYLEKYITQTIEAQSAVKSAKVHLSFPKDNGTLAAQKEEASAFIQLELDGTFTSANAAALAKCVATWLRNDTTANITIMDTDSNLLFAGGDDYSTAGIANSMQELQNQAESMIANQVNAYIQSHIYEKLSTTRIADALGFSNSYVCSEFKKATGTTITKHLTACKINEAKYLLERGEYSATEISDMLQFSSVTYFCNIFKKYSGMTPLEWKNKQEAI